jgi:hypothetical protein
MLGFYSWSIQQRILYFWISCSWDEEGLGPLFWGLSLRTLQSRFSSVASWCTWICSAISIPAVLRFISRRYRTRCLNSCFVQGNFLAPSPVTVKYCTSGSTTADCSVQSCGLRCLEEERIRWDRRSISAFCHSYSSTLPFFSSMLRQNCSIPDCSVQLVVLCMPSELMRSLSRIVKWFYSFEKPA